MPSPFPGMDPYLEDADLWRDVHHELISNIRHILSAWLRPKYSIRIENRAYISDEIDPGITLIDNEIHEPRIEVIERTRRAVVTVIEILSPTNKLGRSQGRASYARKRREIMASSTHLVEIDLLRSGAGFLPCEMWGPHEYSVCIFRANQRPQAEVWPIRLEQPLPIIPIPLLGADSDAILQLQAALDSSYDLADYGQEVDYRTEPIPPLSPEQAQWADALLRERGLR